jgi:hypothetical protein
MSRLNPCLTFESFVSSPASRHGYLAALLAFEREWPMRALLRFPFRRHDHTPRQHLGAKLRWLAPLRDHLDQRRGQERQPNEPSDLAHVYLFSRRYRGERGRPPRGQLVKPPPRAANGLEQGEVNFGPRSVSVRHD